MKSSVRLRELFGVFVVVVVFGFFWPSGKCKIQFYLSPKGQVSEEGDSQEDGRDSTADVGDKGEDGGLETAGYGLPGEVLWARKKISQSVGLKNIIIDDNYT